MYWRILAIIVVLVGASYLLGKRPHGITEAQSQGDVAGAEQRPETADGTLADGELAAEIAFAPSNADMPMPMPAVQPSATDAPKQDEKSYSLALQPESRRIAAAAGVVIGAIHATDKLPPQSPMAMTFRRGACVLLVNAALPLEGTVLNNLSAYGRRQLTFTLGHEIGHCYVLTQVAQRDATILPSLSPPGKAYSFEQYVAMMGNYSEYPDLNRWNEEWADTFSAYILNRVYGREFAMAVTSERFSLRKDQERNGSVLMSNVYGGHASLTEESLFAIRSPLEIANLVKLGRLNTSH